MLDPVLMKALQDHPTAWAVRVADSEGRVLRGAVRERTDNRPDIVYINQRGRVLVQAKITLRQH